MPEDRILYLIALPIIVVLVIIEYIYRQRSGKFKGLNINILASNTLLGLIDRLFFLCYGVLLYEIMKILQFLALIELNINSYLKFSLLFVLVDFIWYWYHRIMHNVPLLWAFHSTHHQTKEYSLTLGFRLSFLTQILRGLFWLPLVLLGFEPIYVLTAIFFQNFYQFFIHTEIWSYPNCVRRILVTPQSHHLHHSGNTNNNNANYGGVLIIWDYIFKTYKFPYDKDNKLCGPLAESVYVHPINGLFLPITNYIFRNSGIKTVGRNLSISVQTRKNKLFITLIFFLIPSLLLIYFGSNIQLKWLVISTLGLILLILATLYYSFKNTK